MHPTSETLLIKAGTDTDTVIWGLVVESAGRCDQEVMMESAEQLQKLYLAGFDIQTFDRLPQAVGVARGECIALLEVTPQGLRMIGTPGWRMGEIMGVLTEKEGRQVFQAKSELVEATPERLSALQDFRRDIERELLPVA